jgi:hypothetical protein
MLQKSEPGVIPAHLLFIHYSLFIAYRSIAPISSDLA